MRSIRQHLMITATLLVGCLVLLLLLFGHGGNAQLLAGVFAAAAAVQRGAEMIREMSHGRWGVDFLAVTAIASTIAVGEYLAALIVVLMLYSGSEPETHASGRAKAELGALLSRVPQTAHGEEGGSSKTCPSRRPGPGTCCSSARQKWCRSTGGCSPRAGPPTSLRSPVKASRSKRPRAMRS